MISDPNKVFLMGKKQEELRFLTLRPFAASQETVDKATRPGDSLASVSLANAADSKCAATLFSKAESGTSSCGRACEGGANRDNGENPAQADCLDELAHRKHGTTDVTRCGIASDADHRHHAQNNRGQGQGDTNVVSDYPFCHHALVVCRRLRHGATNRMSFLG